MHVFWVIIAFSGNPTRSNFVDGINEPAMTWNRLSKWTSLKCWTSTQLPTALHMMFKDNHPTKKQSGLSLKCQLFQKRGKQKKTTNSSLCPPSNSLSFSDVFFSPVAKMTVSTASPAILGKFWRVKMFGFRWFQKNTNLKRPTHW